MPNHYNKLPQSFYIDGDVLSLSKNLLGKHLVSNSAEGLCAGMITETEAYRAPEDKASHAYNWKRTARTDVFYKRGGHAYVYLIYGMYDMFNVITGKKDQPHAVLIRAIEPIDGMQLMCKRRKLEKVSPLLTNGPGKLCQALGIDRKSHNKLRLWARDNDSIWISESNKTIREEQIVSSPRIGIAYAKEWADVPWRFHIKDSKWISKK